VYSWLWRHLPFGRPGRILGSLVLLAAVGALLWYVVFPRIEQYVPGTDGQVTSQDGNTGADSVAPTGTAGPPPGVIPYSTTSNNPEPATTR